MKQDLAWTAAAQAVTAISGFAALAAVSHLISESALGVYSNFNRILGSCIPLSLLGSTIYASREVGALEREDREKLRALLIGTAGISLFGICLTLLVIYFYRGGFYKSMGGYEATDSSPLFFFFLFSCVLVSNCGYTLSYSIHRGRMKFASCGIIQVCWAILPVMCAVIAKGKTFGNYLVILASSQILTCALISTHAGVGTWKRSLPTELKKIGDLGKELFSFGFARLPLFFLAGAVLSFGAMLLNLRNDYSGAIKFGISFTLIRYFGLSVASLGVVLLPKLRTESEGNRDVTINKLVHTIHRFAYLAGPIIAIAVPVFIPFLMAVPKNTLTSPDFLKFCVLAVPGLLSYEILRNINDAIYHKPYNTQNYFTSILAGAAVGGILYYLGNPLLAVVYIGTGLIYSLLGFLTIVRIYIVRGSTFPRRIKTLLFFRAASICILVVAPAEMIEKVIIGVFAIELSIACFFRKP